MQHGRHQSFPRNPSSHHTPLSRQLAGTFNDCFSSSRRPSLSAHAPTTIKNDNDQQLAPTENAVRHASEAAGLGPVHQAQNSAAAGSSTDRQAAGYYSGAGPHPSAPMGNSGAPLAHNHNHIRIPQFENTTTQSTGHDRTGVGGGRNSNIDAGDKHAGSGGLPLPVPAEHPTAQPICKQGGIRYAVEITRAYDTPSSLGLTEVVGLC